MLPVAGMYATYVRYPPNLSVPSSGLIATSVAVNDGAVPLNARLETIPPVAIAFVYVFAPKRFPAESSTETLM